MQLTETGSAALVPNWFAIHTRSRFEKKVAEQLSEKQLQTFLPLRKEVHRWKDRYKPVELPLFGGYVSVLSHITKPAYRSSGWAA